MGRYRRYRGDRRLKRGCRKGLDTVGSRVIPYKKSEPNMVEVECPQCTSTVDLGSNTTGIYECPHCHEDFEYESSLEDYRRGIKANMGVVKVTKPFGGYYRLGNLVDAPEDGGLKFDINFWLLPLFPIIIPWILGLIGLKIVQGLIYKLGGHPGKMLVEVDHIYIQPDGRVIVPIYGLAPFKFNIEGKMRIQTHYDEGEWRSVSIIKGRKIYFSLAGLEHSNSTKEKVYQFLRRFNLEECARHTSHSPS